MGTVVAIQSEAGVAIAGDTSVVSDETVTSEHLQRVFDFKSVGAGAVGEVNDIQQFERRLEAELQREQLEQGRDFDIEKVARIAARQAQRTNVDAVIASRDSDGTARIREVGSDGRVLESSTIALGSGAEIAMAQLDTVERELVIDDIASFLHDVLEMVMDRDTDTGGEIDVWTLANNRSEAD